MKGERQGFLGEITLRPAGSGTGVSGTADTCSPAVSCTRCSDPRSTRCPPRRSDGETCGASPAVISDGAMFIRA